LSTRPTLEVAVLRGLCRGLPRDSLGNAYVTGSTSSADFPTVSPLQASLRGFKDAYVTKLNASGNALVYSTYLGGSSEDYANGDAVNSLGTAVVTGSKRRSADFPTVNRSSQRRRRRLCHRFCHQVEYSGG